MEREKLQNEIMYVGVKQYEELPRYYGAMDILVFPTKLPESLGLVGLEALGFGVPVIGSNIGGLTDYIINGHNGYLFEPGNDMMLSDLLWKYYNFSPDRKKEISWNAYRSSLSYEKGKVATELANALKGLLKNAFGDA